MSLKQEVRSQDWFKAAACAVVFLIVMFLLITRSSCSSAGGAGSSSATEESEAVSTESEGKGNDESDVKPVEEDTKEGQPGANPVEIDPEKQDEPPSVQPTPGDPKPTSSPPTVGGDGDSDGQTAVSPGGQSIGGLAIKGERLGVILDVSGSMSRYLESLRTEINSQFKAPVFLEVEGCLLEPSSFDPAGIESPRSSNPRLRGSAMNAIRELVEVNQVDSVYWFCDLQDERTEAALKELMALVRGGGADSPVFHLYVRSTDKAPDSELENIIRSSGGAFERRR